MGGRGRVGVWTEDHCPLFMSKVDSPTLSSASTLVKPPAQLRNQKLLPKAAGRCEATRTAERRGRKAPGDSQPTPHPPPHSSGAGSPRPQVQGLGGAQAAHTEGAGQGSDE